MTSELSGRLASTGRLLVRSSLEMGRTLEAMQKNAAPVTASLEEGNVLFLSRLLQVDAQRETIVLACSELKSANAALLACRTVTFACNHDGVHCEFSAAAPREAAHDGRPAIALEFPAALLMQQRRGQRRFAVPPSVPLRCEVRLGPVSFDAKVVDISPEGLGAILYEPGIRLEPGTRLHRTRIKHPERAPILADLEVRHVTQVVLPDGVRANRAGCKFVGGARDLEDLIRLFVNDLGAPR